MSYYRIKSLIYKCPVCKKEFNTFRYSQKFCSIKCSAKGRKGIRRKNQIKIKCDYCGRESYQKKSQIEKRQYHFCSRKCYWLFKRKESKGNKNPNWKGGISLMKKTGEKELRRKGIKTKLSGAIAEREVKKILEEKGFFAIKSSGSIGLWDIWAVNNKELKLIQVKSTSSKIKLETLFKEDIEKMKRVKVAGHQELWVRRKFKKVFSPLERYDIKQIIYE